MARANPIAAIRSDYFVTAEGRDYDYGMGFGGALRGTGPVAGKATVRVNGGFVWLPVVSGFSGNHYLWTVSTELRGYYPRQVRSSASCYNRLWRFSRYTFNPDVDQDMSEARVFLSLAIPRWEHNEPPIALAVGCCSAPGAALGLPGLDRADAGPG